MVDQPSKSDIESVFHRLRAVPANKECFDCNAKNPTWASITYGIFICIDCSAVHRSLGVHLTFVRSTQLDTNWTWIQLRQMQVGGNANARQFFSQHNCTTTDAQKKYNSRAAQLYREKLQQAAVKAMNNNSGESDLSFAKIETQHPTEGPKVDFHLTESKPTERVSTIGVRKVQPKKSGLGAKRSGLGATKVKTNFADIEKEAVLAEEIRQRNIEEVAKAEALSIKEKEEKEAAFRLAYKDLSNEQHRKEEQLKKADPRKAEQVERLGMGFNTRSGISHSVMSDLKSIEQENVESTTNSLNSLGKLRLSDNDGFFDSFSYSSGFNMNRNSNAASPASRGLEALLASDNEKLKDWTIIDDPVIDKPKSSKSSYVPIEKNPVRNSYPESSSSDMAQKKFGSAKGISSDQFFGDRENDYEVQANLNRFQGSSSISSSEFFGHGSDNASYNKFQTPDLDDVRESVRQGVSKVAGKISSLANGVMSSIQERYGY
ncbi:ADP-ribosylation factor GTPase-activating protein 2 isoform X2 [Agrilus planipennis]|uniref:ADP-ribosylation factor GTPase-activating protein 2 isoform X2 n=1 Tax=Agrilus planipennis TaxID=224129 RepID=A0A7F5QXW0_AGRPL|nr:ADP-ribosylation factor GTPase-activating protein 2 isoform X2 [Agrilus planipennis]